MNEIKRDIKGNLNEVIETPMITLLGVDNYGCKLIEKIIQRDKLCVNIAAHKSISTQLPIKVEFNKDSLHCVLKSSKIAIIFAEDYCEPLATLSKIAKNEFGLLTLAIIPPNSQKDKITQNTDSVLITKDLKKIIRFVKSINRIITIQGIVNLDITDLNYLLKASDVFEVSFGVANGINRASQSVQTALNKCNIEGATNILINVETSCKACATLSEISIIMELIRTKVGENASLIWGHSYNKSLGSKLSVFILANGCS